MLKCERTTTPLNIDDLIVQRSDRFDSGALCVSVHEFPDCSPATITPERAAYSFWYRPRTEKGETRVTVPELHLSDHRISRDHVPVFPPLLPVHGVWDGAGGRVARFSFSPRFFEAIAGQVDAPPPGVHSSWHAFFAIDQRLEALCWLLMEETEARGPHGPLYFEPLARALAVAVLSALLDHDCNRERVRAVPQGIRRILRTLETDFANDFSMADLADKAQLSRSHFARTFRRLTGYTPHQYLLRVRLNQARKLLVQNNKAMALSEIAETCGFFDQAHLSRHFRRFFGITPDAFRRRQDGP